MPATSSPIRTRLGQELDTYKDTVTFLVALIHELTWDEQIQEPRKDVQHEHGSKQARGMGDSVTPDLAMMLGKQHGIIGEAKTSFGRSADACTKIRDQLLKYDEVVEEWTHPKGMNAKPRVTEGCVILLTHHTRKVEAADYLEAERKAGRFGPKHPFAIVGAVRAPQANTEEFITLERSFGNLLPPAKDVKLRAIVPIRLDHLTTRYAVKFYDQQPPMAYLLEVIWDAILPPLIPEESFRPASGRAKPIAEVTTEAVADQLRDKYSMRLLNPNLPASPRVSFVREALDQMVKYGLGVKDAQGKYRFEYRRLRRGTLEFFLQKLVGTPQKKHRSRSAKQMSLFQPRPSGISTLDDSDES